MDRSRLHAVPLGVEEKIQLLGPETLVLVPGMDMLAA